MSTRINNLNSTPPASISRASDTQKKLADKARSVVNHTENLPTSIEKTTKKTVHFSDLNKLEKKIKSVIKEMSQAIQGAKSNDLFTRIGAENKINNISKKLAIVKKNIGDYQSKIESSSYKHHVDKPKALSLFSDNVKNAENKLNIVKNQNEYSAKSSDLQEKNAAQRAKDKNTRETGIKANQ